MTANPDFTVFDAYVNDQGLIAFEDGDHKQDTQTLPPQSDKVDVGNNPFEQRPEFGDHFSQGEFSRGAGQTYFHRPGRDERRYAAGEGFDISKDEFISHAPITNKVTVVSNGKDGDPIPMVVVKDRLFVAPTNRVERVNATLTALEATENPFAGESETNREIVAMATDGENIYLAFADSSGAESAPATNGIHKRDGAGTWTHFSAYNATRLAWVKDRLIAADGRSIAEINIATGAATTLETLPVDWSFKNIFESGPFVYACAVNLTANRSQIQHYGLGSTGVMEKKGSTPMPNSEFAYCGATLLNAILIGGGWRTPEGDIMPIVYQAYQQSSGELLFSMVAQEDISSASGANLSVRAILAERDTFYVGWYAYDYGVTSSSTAMLLAYNVARDAVYKHSRANPATASAPIRDMVSYGGKLIHSINASGVYAMDTAKFLTTASLITSIADWSNAGIKVWDRLRINFQVPPASVAVHYTTGEPKQDATWVSVPGTLAGNTFEAVMNVLAPRLALRIATTVPDDAAGGDVWALTTPKMKDFTLRSVPITDPMQWVLVRHFRLFGQDRKDPQGEVTYEDVHATKHELQDLCHGWVTFHEADMLYDAFVQNVKVQKITEPLSDRATLGEGQEEGYIVTLQMVATEAM